MTEPVASFRRIGVALAGTGFMGRVHAEALRRIGVDLVGVLGSNPEKSARAAAEYGARRAYASYDQLLSDPDVQAVHILTPNRLHVTLAAQALESGRHVMCEKPLALSSTESALLADLARRHPQQAAAVNYNIRYYPLCFEMRERVRSGGTGRLHHITGSYAQDWLARDTDYNWRVLAEEGGALRAISDIGTHWLDLAQFITGLKITAVCADLKTVHPVRHRPAGELQTFGGSGTPPASTLAIPVTTDDCGAVLLRFEGGAQGCLWVSQVSPGRKNLVRLEIAAAEQTLAWNSEDPDSLWVGRRDRAGESVQRDPAALHPAAGAASDLPAGHSEGYADTFKQCFRSFYTAILRGGFHADPPFPSFEDGHREILLCDAIARSAREERWVKLDEGHP